MMFYGQLILKLIIFTLERNKDRYCIILYQFVKKKKTQTIQLGAWK